MKKTLLLTFSLCLLAYVSSFGQTIRRVNNSLGVTGTNVYATAQAAHDAAVAGDIIYLEPSSAVSNDYGNLTITKQLTIIGPGYFLIKNPNTPFDTREPSLSTVTFNNGSANSIIRGISISALNLKCNNITFNRCRINSFSFGTDNVTVPATPTYANYITVTQCFLTAQLFGNGGGASPNSGNNITLVNNLITTQFSVNISSLKNSVINRNVIIPSSYGQFGSCLQNLNGCTVTNNIFDLRSYNNANGGNPIADPVSNIGCTYSNNICVGYNGLPTGNGNVNNASSTNFFTGANTPLANYSSLGDGVFQLSATSPALTVASDGGQAGMFGGTSPYVLSGLPPNPIITNFNISGAGNSTTPLNVSVTVRGNN